MITRKRTLGERVNTTDIKKMSVIKSRHFGAISRVPWMFPSMSTMLILAVAVMMMTVSVHPTLAQRPPYNQTTKAPITTTTAATKTSAPPKKAIPATPVYRPFQLPDILNQRPKPQVSISPYAAPLALPSQSINDIGASGQVAIQLPGAKPTSLLPAEKIVGIEPVELTVKFDNVATVPCSPEVVQSVKDTLGIGKFWALWNYTVTPANIRNVAGANKCKFEKCSLSNF